MEEDVFKDYAICVELDDEEVEQIRDGRITQIGLGQKGELLLYDAYWR